MVPTTCVSPCDGGTSSQTPAELILAFQVGDRGAFAALYTLLFERLVGRYMRRGAMSRHDAEDAAQDLFVKLLYYNEPAEE